MTEFYKFSLFLFGCLHESQALKALFPLLPALFCGTSCVVLELLHPKCLFDERNLTSFHQNQLLLLFSITSTSL
jgi:hypothetical protein